MIRVLPVGAKPPYRVGNNQEAGFFPQKRIYTVMGGAKQDNQTLSATAAAKLLRVDPDVVKGHIKQGLPLVKGRIDLILYAAWLNQREGNATDGSRPQQTDSQ